jgi:UrcA family protein
MTRGMLLAAGAMVGMLSPAALAGDREVRSITVDAAALDLSNPAGLDELSHRIGRAVNRICGSDRDCQDEAWASTEGQVAWVVSHDEMRRRMADAHAAELMSCGGSGCTRLQPVRYRPPGPPAAVVVTIIYGAPAAYRR